ncbi:FadR/GntR family transcriptional regulator [Conexibacter woesei]|uniref:GntR domain protein n=1 Tax=Conexibacter woesei (strain DSM 14684 / CCUG 47730 / CIP 108061 / JCM 11494 / NBRC 100937 / ID131577) TaxID=469383 RepID=D3F9U1_CONWI|nr:FadR/GntR family transcriptional regulator [Conexibacter woesei]ADB51153.1 GntR domain protein [Conexibacter woesei DSM 14684]
MTTPPEPDATVEHPFSAVRVTRSFDEVVRQLHAGLLSGRYQPGDRLPNERELGELLRVGRSTVREALRTLELQGLVEVRPGRNGGIFAAEPSGRSVGDALETLLRFRQPSRAELLEFRVSFEGETAWWAARRATDEDHARLRALADAVGASARASGRAWEQIADDDVAFHAAVAEASRNQVRVAVMQAINHPLREGVLAMGASADDAVRVAVADDLREIAEAIAAGDADLARDRMREHVERNPALNDAAGAERA